MTPFWPTGSAAYEHLVDRLLDSPHYGENWARHWLDLVRYGETNGYERDSAKPFAWRYRDYVIDAFNRDKPYDRFVREQLAGDEVTPASAEALIATGFYRLGIWDDEPADRPLARYDGLDGIVSTTGQVFLGMTINCARCHDHKVDPIPQRDYYRLLAFFQDVTDPDGKNLRKVDAGGGSRIDVMCVAEWGRAQAHVLLRGNPSLVGDRGRAGSARGARRRLAGSFADGPGQAAGPGRLADRPRNPRTARVLANRLWQYHFGRGIVPTPNDFGKLGEPATHPELLDWLAAELVAGGWRIKPMHRLIVLSSAYRMSSRATPAELAADPSNRWFWRFPMRRLAAEEVRDSILAVSGELRLKAGGPSVYPADPREVLAGQSVPGRDGRPRRPTKPRGGASTCTSSGRSWSRSWRRTTRPIPTPVARCGTRRPCRPRRSACSMASSPTSRPPASPTGSAARPPATSPPRSAGHPADDRPRARPPTRSAATSSSSTADLQDRASTSRRRSPSTA